jgi:PRTRC genetic system protein A
VDIVTLPNPIKYHFYQGQDLPESWPYAYLVAQEGVYKMVDTPHFWAYVRLAACRVAGLYHFVDTPAAAILNVPKIPSTWLYAVLDHARKAGQPNGGVLRPVEQMYHFHWLESCWRVAVPKQKATTGQVTYRGGDEASVVLDLHSHHEMGAFFSQTDNRDEQNCRFYAVIGKIYSRPELRLRVGIYGDWAELDPLLLFEGLGPFVRAGGPVIEKFIDEEYG